MLGGAGQQLGRRELPDRTPRRRAQVDLQLAGLVPVAGAVLARESAGREAVVRVVAGAQVEARVEGVGHVGRIPGHQHGRGLPRRSVPLVGDGGAGLAVVTQVERGLLVGPGVGSAVGLVPHLEQGTHGPAQRAGQRPHPGRGVAGRGPHRRPGQQEHPDQHDGGHGHPRGPGPHQATERTARQGAQSPAGADEPVDGLAPGGTSPGQVEQGTRPDQDQHGPDHRAHDGHRFGVGAPSPQDHDPQRHQQRGDHPGRQPDRRAHAGGQARAHRAGPVHVDAQRGDHAHHDQQRAGHVVAVPGEALAQRVTQPGWARPGRRTLGRGALGRRLLGRGALGWRSLGGGTLGPGLLLGCHLSTWGARMTIGWPPLGPSAPAPRWTRGL